MFTRLVALSTGQVTIHRMGMGETNKNCTIYWIEIYLALIVQNVDNAIHRINVYPLNSAIGFPNAYPLDSDLSGG